jgi:formamidopyrimidine-DNA glycosylase
MPELPEVEVTRRGFADRITQARVLGVAVGKPLRWPLGIEPSALVGRRVAGVRRRGKYILIDLDEGLLLLHLGMSGSLRFAPELPPRGPHDHFDLVTSRGVLRLRDPRRFGAVVWAPDESAEVARVLLGRLGVEPLGEDFGLAAFREALRRRRASIKQVLLAGDVVVGVGNIYASEALFSAGIRPTVSAMQLGPRRVARLQSAIREVLARAVARGGSTLRDFAGPDGEDGHFQQEAMVYGRDGQACHRCGHLIHALRQGQRSTFYCPRCQRA